MTDRVGQRLGNYRLVHLLGRGGFAEVYLGQHLRLNMQAAIKILHTQLADADDIENFQLEAQTVASLIHPHIVRVLDFDVKDGVPFLVIDYAPNGSLRRQHAKGVPLPLPTIVSYVKQIANALQYAHEQKLIHRDVKPENMLLGRRNEVLLSDFGIATIAQSSRYQGTQDMAGTITYMAPEQIQGKPRPASDQYALGVVVYEWLCGQRPFHGSYSEIAVQHTITPPPPLREKVPTILPDIEQIVLTALAKDPRQRFVSVQAFATALEQASRERQTYSSIASQAPTVPSQPLLPPKMASPVMPLSQQKVTLPPSEVVQTPLALPDKSRQPVSISNLQSKPEPAHQSISRRTIVLGLGVAGLAVAGGGIAWLLFPRSSISPSSLRSTSISTSIPPSPHPTPTPTSKRIPLGTLLYAYHGHSSFVDAVVWSPDGQRIASGSSDSTVQVWNAADGGHVLTYRGHTQGVQAVAWSPDGKRIASASADNTVQIWNAADGSHDLIYRGHSSGVKTMAWSPDGRRIASASDDRTVQVWDAVDGGHVFTYRGHAQGVQSVTWSPDSRRIASASADRTVQVWDAANGGHVFTYQGHSNAQFGVYVVAWSPDGRRIASASDDRTVQVWDAVDGGHVFTYRGHSNGVWAAAWSPNGTRIASGSSDKTVQVWDAADGGHVFTYRGHSDFVLAVPWSPDGTRIASGSQDKTVQVWVAG